MRDPLPGEQGRGPGEAGAEGGEEHEVVLLELPLLDRLAHADRDGGGCRVPGPLDGVYDLLVRDAEIGSDHLVDTHIRLMREEESHLIDLFASPGEDLAAHLHHASDGVLKDHASVHLPVVPALVEKLVGDSRVEEACRSLGPELPGVLAFRVEGAGHDPGMALRGRAHHHGSGAVAEKDRNIPAVPGEIEARGVNFGPYEEDVIIEACLYEAVSGGKAIDEPRTLVADIHGPDGPIAEKAFLEEAAV